MGRAGWGAAGLPASHPGGPYEWPGSSRITADDNWRRRVIAKFNCPVTAVSRADQSDARREHLRCEFRLAVLSRRTTPYRRTSVAVLFTRAVAPFGVGFLSQAAEFFCASARNRRIRRVAPRHGSPAALLDEGATVPRRGDLVECDEFGCGIGLLLEPFDADRSQRLDDRGFSALVAIFSAVLPSVHPSWENPTTANATAPTTAPHTAGFTPGWIFISSPWFERRELLRFQISLAT